MIKRPIIEIDEEKCDGCGMCVNACAEGAIQIIKGKAKLVNEIFCDGLGACIGSCPRGAIKIVERQVKPFNEKATKKHLEILKTAQNWKCECIYEKDYKLSNWPIQLKLVSVNASFFKDASLVIAADCTAFSFINFHKDILKDKKLIIACPKLDDTSFYLEKLIEIFKTNSIKAVTVVRMTVPCCGRLIWLVKEAIKDSGKALSFEEKEIDLDGNIRNP